MSGDGFTEDELEQIERDLSETDNNTPPAADAGDTETVPKAQDVDESRLTAWCAYETTLGFYLEQTFRTRPPTERMLEVAAEAGNIEWRRV